MSAVTLEDVMAALEGLRREMRTELDALKADVESIKTQHAREAEEKDAEITPETLVMLAAVVTSYLGKRVRIRSARLVPSDAAAGAPAWARHGRAAIQTSHILHRGH